MDLSRAIENVKFNYVVNRTARMEMIYWSFKKWRLCIWLFPRLGVLKELHENKNFVSFIIYPNAHFMSLNSKYTSAS